MMYSSNAESYRQFLIDRTKQYQSIVGASPTDGQVKQASAVDFIKNNKRIQMMEKADKVGKSVKNTTPSSLGERAQQENRIATRAQTRGVEEPHIADKHQQSKNTLLGKSVQQRAAMRNRMGDSSAFGSHSGPELQINKAYPHTTFGVNKIVGEDFKPKRASFDILGNYN